MTRIAAHKSPSAKTIDRRASGTTVFGMGEANEYIKELFAQRKAIIDECLRQIAAIDGEIENVTRLATKALLDGKTSADELADVCVRERFPEIERGSDQYEKELDRWWRDTRLLYGKNRELAAARRVSQLGRCCFLSCPWDMPGREEFLAWFDDTLEEGGFPSMIEAYCEGVPIEDIDPDDVGVYEVPF